MNFDSDITWIADRILDGLIMPCKIEFDKTCGECSLHIWLPEKGETQKNWNRLTAFTNCWRRYVLQIGNISDIELILQIGEPSNRYYTCSGLRLSPQSLTLTTHDGFVFVATLCGIPKLKFSPSKECAQIKGY